MKQFLLYIAMALLPLVSEAQDYFHWINFAEEATADGDHYGAAQYYSYAFAVDSSDQNVQYAYAEALMRSHHYWEAERLFIKIYSKGRGRFFPEGPKRIAQLLMYRGAYEQSIKYWRRAERYASEGSEEAQLIAQRLKSCAYALSHPEEDESIAIKNAGGSINTTDSEFGGELSPSGAFLYASLRGPYNQREELKEPEQYYSRIYQSEWNEGIMSPASPYTGLRSAMSHQGNPSFSLDGEYIYFSECPSPDSCRIMRVSALDTIPRLVGNGVNAEGSNSQPCIANLSNKEFLIFSSDRAGGQGGMDLWIAPLSFSGPPTLLAGGINSPGNEVCPYHKDDVLYFSSDWHEGFGGYDVFTTPLGLYTVPLGQPKNMGKPINSPVNDLYYRQYEALEILTSNRLGSLTADAPHCCNDIYILEREQVEDLSAEELAIDEVPEQIESVDQLKGLLPISLYFHNDVPDPGSQSEQTELSYAETIDSYIEMQGKYQTQYSSGLSAARSDSARVQMGRFFREEVKAEYEKLEGVSRLLLEELNKGKKIEIAIKGYASPLAQSDYNRKLTQRRITSVLNYLRRLDDGVLLPYMDAEAPSLFIVPIPYGESESEAMVSDNPQDAKNSIYSIAAARERRVEILRISEVD